MRAFGQVVLLDTVAAEHLCGARLFFNARYFLAAASAKPIPATKSLGNLDGEFVARAAADMRWPPQPPEIVRFIGPTVDELDLPSLHRLRVVLQNGRLLRNYRGAFHSTVLARELMTPGREGELYAALFTSYFTATDLASLDGHPSDPLLQRATPRLLWLLGRVGDRSTTVAELAVAITVDAARWQDSALDSGFAHLCTALRQRILEPLEEFDLLLVGAPSTDGAADSVSARVRVTELFARFVIASASLN